MKHLEASHIAEASQSKPVFLKSVNIDDELQEKYCCPAHSS